MARYFRKETYIPLLHYHFLGYIKSSAKQKASLVLNQVMKETEIMYNKSKKIKAQERQRRKKNIFVNFCE